MVVEGNNKNRIIIATIMRLDGDTGVQTHFNQACKDCWSKKTRRWLW